MNHFPLQKPDTFYFLKSPPHRLTHPFMVKFYILYNITFRKCVPSSDLELQVLFSALAVRVNIY